MLGFSTEHLSTMEVDGRTGALNQATPALKGGRCLVQRKRSEIDRNTTEMVQEQHGEDVWMHLGLPGCCWEPCCPSCMLLLQTYTKKTRDLTGTHYTIQPTKMCAKSLAIIDKNKWFKSNFIKSYSIKSIDDI